MKRILIITLMLAWGVSGYAQNDAKEVRTVDELVSIAANMKESYILMNDLRVNDWIPIGGIDGDEENGFTGTLDGNGHTVTINSFNTNLDNSRVGLFGLIGKGGIVKNLRVAGKVDYVGGQKLLYVGGITGMNEGLILGCVSSIDLTCDYVKTQGQKKGKPLPGYEGMWIGGCIVGVNLGSVIHCYSDGAIRMSQGDAGGISGANGKPVLGSFGISVGPRGVGVSAAPGNPPKIMAGLSYCYSTASVSGGSAGGITALHRADAGALNNCVVMCRSLTAKGAYPVASPFPHGGGASLGVSHPNFQFYFLDNLDIHRYNDKNVEMKPSKLSPKRAVALFTTQSESWWRLPEGLPENERKTMIGFPFGTEDEWPWTWDENLKRPVLYWENNL